MKLFEDVKHVNPKNGSEYWFARELQPLLEYKEWRNFLSVVEKAKTACQNSNIEPSDHFIKINKMVGLGSGAKREVDDIAMTRYACYLVAQNGQTRREITGLGV